MSTKRRLSLCCNQRWKRLEKGKHTLWLESLNVVSINNLKVILSTTSGTPCVLWKPGLVRSGRQSNGIIKPVRSHLKGLCLTEKEYSGWHFHVSVQENQRSCLRLAKKKKRERVWKKHIPRTQPVYSQNWDGGGAPIPRIDGEVHSQSL